MKQKAILSIVVLCSIGVALAQEKPKPDVSPAPAGQAPTFPAQVEQVIVDVVVTDKKGVPVTNLTQAEFQVLEDNQPQQIASFEKVELPEKPTEEVPPPPRVASNTENTVHNARTFVVVFDDIHMAPFQARRAKGAVAEFLKDGVREGDIVTLVAAGGGAWWSTRMTAGRDELMALLKRFDGRQIPDTSQDRMTDYEAMRIHVYHDAQVADRVARRYQTYGVNPGSQNSQGGSSQGAVQGATADQDPMVMGKASEVYFQAVTKNRITLDVLQRVLLSLRGVKGRKSMILVSEGFIYDPNMDEFKDVKEASRRANVAVYYLDTRGLGGASIYATAQFGPPLPDQDVGAAFTENLEASEGSESIAADTGGFTVKNTNDLGKGIKKIADETRAYYLLGYNPTNTARDGKFRTIKVRVAGKNLEIRARKGYYAPSPDGTRAAAERAKKKGVDLALQSALDAPWDQPEIPIRMLDHVLDETMLGKATVLLSADVDMAGFAFEDKEGRFNDTLEFMLVVAHRETGEYFRYDQKYDMHLLPATREKYKSQWFSATKDFELSPGGYQAKLVVRDKNSGVIGSVVHNFVVPELNQFRASSPVITDNVQVPKDSLDNRPKPQLVARRTFKSEGMLYCSYEVFGADKDKKTGMPKVSAGYVLQGKDGKVFTSAAPSVIQPTSLGKLSRMMGMRMDGIAPGDYELILNIKDELSGKSLLVHEPLKVVG